jgi:hypothetical protein
MRPLRTSFTLFRNGHAPAGIQMSFASGYVGSGGNTPITVCV